MYMSVFSYSIKFPHISASAASLAVPRSRFLISHIPASARIPPKNTCTVILARCELRHLDQRRLTFGKISASTVNVEGWCVWRESRHARVRNRSHSVSSKLAPVQHLQREQTFQASGMATSSTTGEVKEKGVIFFVAKTVVETDAFKQSLSVKPLTIPDDLSLIEGVVADNLQPTQNFSGCTFMESIDSRLIARLLLFSPRMASTQSLLSENFKLLPIGTMCVSDVQFKGKGRGGNSWESPPGCLMVSFTLQESDGRTLPFLQYVVCLAIVQAVEHLSQQRDATLQLSIKWPNDLYADGLKMGGILCNSTYSNKKFNVVVGFGLNVDNRQPTTCLNALLAQSNPTARPLSREEVLAAFVVKFEDLHDRFLTSGFETLRNEYLARWLHTGQRVVLEEASAEGQGRTQIPLTVQGLTESGYLLATNHGGEAFELHPDGNSLDFFKGLIRRKLQE